MIKITKRVVHKIANNDYYTIKRLYDDYYKLVKFVIIKYVNNHDDADELVQDVFLKVCKNIKSFNYNLDFTNWIFTIAKNTAIDFLKSKKHNIAVDLLDESQIIDEDINRSNFTINENIDQKIKEVLTKDEYDIIAYRLFYNMKYKEIAKILDSNISIVSNKYYRAIKKLKKHIKKEDFYE